MVRRSQGRTRFSGQRSRRRMEWRGAAIFSVLATGTTPILIGSTATISSMTSPTILTIDGWISFATVLSAVSAGGLYTAGILVKSVVYAAVVPSPLLDPDLSWMWWHRGIVQGPSVVSGGARTIERLRLKVKAKRRLEETDEIFLLVHNEGPDSIDLTFGARLLYSEGR